MSLDASTHTNKYVAKATSSVGWGGGNLYLATMSLRFSEVGKV